MILEDQKSSYIPFYKRGYLIIITGHKCFTCFIIPLKLPSYVCETKLCFTTRCLSNKFHGEHISLKIQQLASVKHFLFHGIL